MERIAVTDEIFYVDLGPVAVPVYDNGQVCVVFDTGIDKAAAKKIIKAAEKTPDAVYLTHYHADHSGGAKYLSENENVPVYISEKEISFLKSDGMTSAFLYGGLVYKALRGKFLNPPQADKVRPLDLQYLESIGVSHISLAGHSPALTGYMAGGVLIAGDAVLSAELEKPHGVFYYYDISQALNTLEKIKTLDFDKMIISHHGAYSKSDAVKLCEHNTGHISKLLDDVCEMADGRTVQQMTMLMMQDRGVKPNPASALLIQSTLKGAAAYLENKGRLECRFEDEARFYAV